MSDFEPGPLADIACERADEDRWTLVFVRDLRHPPAKVWTALRPFWPSASLANSIIVTLRPAHGELVRSRTKESETFFCCFIPSQARSRARLVTR